MKEQTLQAITSQGHCLAVLDEVARSRTSVVITKHGRAVARLVPMDDADQPTLGSVTLIADGDGAHFSTDEVWDADA